MRILSGLAGGPCSSPLRNFTRRRRPAVVAAFDNIIYLFSFFFSFSNFNARSPSTVVEEGETIRWEGVEKIYIYTNRVFIFFGLNALVLYITYRVREDHSVCGGGGGIRTS